MPIGHSAWSIPRNAAAADVATRADEAAEVSAEQAAAVDGEGLATAGPTAAEPKAEAAAAAPQRLTLRWYDNMYHELFNEITAYRQQVLDDFDRWLTTCLPDPQAEQRQGEPVSAPRS